MSDWTVCRSQYRERTGLLESCVIVSKVYRPIVDLFFAKDGSVLPWKGWSGKETAFPSKTNLSSQTSFLFLNEKG